MIKKLDEMLDVLKGSEKAILSVAAAHDEEVLLAIKSATEMEIITPILVGHEDEIRNISKEINFDLNGIKIINKETIEECSRGSCKIGFFQRSRLCYERTFRYICNFKSSFK